MLGLFRKDGVGYSNRVKFGLFLWVILVLIIYEFMILSVLIFYF